MFDIGNEERKRIKSEGIKLPNHIAIKSLKEGEGYKYLGVLQADEVQEKEMKRKVGNKCKRRVRKILETKLNGGNIIKDANWTNAELEGLYRRLRKLLTMHIGLHPGGDVNRLYIPRKDGERRLMSVEDIVNLDEIGLKRYVIESKEKLLVTARDNTENKEMDAENDGKRK